MRILMIGDIFGRDGRRMVSQYLSKIKNEYKVDVVLANGENAAHGKGLSKRVYDELIFEVPLDELMIVIPLIVEKMENAVNLKVKLKVDYDYGTSWYDC